MRRRHFSAREAFTPNHAMRIPVATAISRSPSLAGISSMVRAQKSMVPFPRPMLRSDCGRPLMRPPAQGAVASDRHHAGAVTHSNCRPLIGLPTTVPLPAVPCEGTAGLVPLLGRRDTANAPFARQSANRMDEGRLMTLSIRCGPYAPAGEPGLRASQSQAFHPIGAQGVAGSDRQRAAPPQAQATTAQGVFDEHSRLEVQLATELAGAADPGLATCRRVEAGPVVAGAPNRVGVLGP